MTGWKGKAHAKGFQAKQKRVTNLQLLGYDPLLEDEARDRASEVKTRRAAPAGAAPPADDPTAPPAAPAGAAPPAAPAGAAPPADDPAAPPAAPAGAVPPADDPAAPAPA